MARLDPWCESQFSSRNHFDKTYPKEQLDRMALDLSSWLIPEAVVAIKAAELKTIYVKGGSENMDELAKTLTQTAYFDTSYGAPAPFQSKKNNLVLLDKVGEAGTDDQLFWTVAERLCVQERGEELGHEFKFQEEKTLKEQIPVLLEKNRNLLKILLEEFKSMQNAS